MSKRASRRNEIKASHTAKSNKRAKQAVRKVMSYDAEKFSELEAIATKQLDHRNNLRSLMRKGLAKRADLDKLDLNHGTHYEVVVPEFRTVMKGKDKVYKSSTVPVDHYTSEKKALNKLKSNFK